MYTLTATNSRATTVDEGPTVAKQLKVVAKELKRLAKEREDEQEPMVISITVAYTDGKPQTILVVDAA